MLGATGQQGRGVIQALRRREKYRIIGVTRDPQSAAAQELATGGVELRRSEMDDPAGLTAAFAGAAFLFVMTQPYTKSGRADIAQELRQGRAIATALAATKAQWNLVVYSSVGGKKQRTGVPHADSKIDVMEMIQATGVPTAELRPCVFMDNLLAAWNEVKEFTVPFITRGDVPLMWIATEDIGEFAAQAFDDPVGAAGTELELAGDRATGTELAAIITRVRQSATPFTYVAAPACALWLFAPDALAMKRAFEDSNGAIFTADIPALRARYPQLLTLEAWLRKRGFDKKPLKKASSCTIS